MRFVALVLCLGLAGCGQAWDHRNNTQLGLELEEQSRHGLGLAKIRYGGKIIDIHFFGRPNEQIELGQPVEAGLMRAISPETIATLELISVGPEVIRSFTKGDPAEAMQAFNAISGNVVLLSASGELERRSALRVNATSLAVSRDHKRIAFAGWPVQPAWPPVPGIYLGDFTSTSPKRLISFNTTQASPGATSYLRPELDWSPESTRLLVSDGGVISLYDVDTAKVERITNGGLARWSPQGNQISYVGPNLEAATLDLASKTTKSVDTGYEIGKPLEWSPDGKYLLVPEGKGSHVPYGCIWVYRVADGAFYSDCHSRLINPLPVWFQR